MRVQFTDGAIFGVAFFFLILLAVTIVLWRYKRSVDGSCIMHYYRKDGCSRCAQVSVPWHSGVLRATVTFVVATVIFNLITLVGSLGYHTPTQSTHDVAATFGFESGAEYPLALGSRLGGSSSDLTGYRRSFTVREKSGSIVSLGFANEGRNYILEIPVSKTTFIVDDTKPPTMRLYIDNDLDGNRRVTYMSPCTIVIESGVLACNRTIQFGVSQSDEEIRKGLGDIVQQHFGSAEITVTQEMYDSILGRK